MQGRLSPKEAQNLQSFPQVDWRLEFARAKSVGFDSIEWLYDVHCGAVNPLLTDAGREEIKACIASTGVTVSSACAHAFVDGSLSWQRDAIDDLLALIQSCGSIDIERLVFPLLEGGAVSSRPEWVEFRNVLKPALDCCVGHNVLMCLETDVPAGELLRWLSASPHPNLRVCYDVGNAVARGGDPVEELNLIADYVAEIHIKDRKIGGSTYPLGEGDTDFGSVVEWLHRSDCAYPIIFETPVGSDWHSSATSNFEFMARRFAGMKAV